MPTVPSAPPPHSRWVRLLFGREFLLQDLLAVWDALFADSITLDLVDYVFVAMLLYIRDACESKCLPDPSELSCDAPSSDPALS